MQVEQIIALAAAYGEHTGLKLSTIGAYSVNDGKFFHRIKAGGSCTLKTANSLMRWLDDRWPDDLEWPRDIPRPSKSRRVA